ncbi:hypothetical protein Salat_2042100 [Sesamum alatum]|uniref:Uncharacterized protein n=1 Tax=Sesamum alatum TaxID=300844 RepID=A0AAE1Y0D1_9LAMI|nr:hypothetical protein Salat_2042100 [Sesamum alatum]
MLTTIVNLVIIGGDARHITQHICQMRKPSLLRLHHVLCQHAHSRAMETGLDPSIIVALPIIMFKQTNGTNNDMGCIDKWFGSNSTCPICRIEANPSQDCIWASSGYCQSIAIGSTARRGQSSSSKVSGSRSRLSSVRWILNRERSSRKIQSQSCGQEEGLPDLESETVIYVN